MAMADQNFRILNPLADGIALVNAAERHLRGDDDGASALLQRLKQLNDGVIDRQIACAEALNDQGVRRLFRNGLQIFSLLDSGAAGMAYHQARRQNG